MAPSDGRINNYCRPITKISRENQCAYRRIITMID